jgi:hypothetical protein
VIDNETQIQLGMETLLSGWGCQVWSPAAARPRSTGWAPTRPT